MQKKDRAALLFIALSLGLAICYWLMILLWPKGSLPSAVEIFLQGIFRDFGPALAAFAAAFYDRRGSGTKDLLIRLARVNVGIRFYLLGLAWPIFAVLTAILGAYFFEHISLNPTANFNARLIVVFFLMAIFDGPLGEEIGWRGFLLPKLLEKRSPIVAALIVGFIWWLWHVPLYLADGRSIPWILFLVDTTALSFIFTWFFLHTKQSIFFAIFLHNVSNYSIYISRMLFPQLQNTTVAKFLFYVVIVLLGLFAAISMLRKRTERLDALAIN